MLKTGQLNQQLGNNLLCLLHRRCWKLTNVSGSLSRQDGAGAGDAHIKQVPCAVQSQASLHAGSLAWLQLAFFCLHWQDIRVEEHVGCQGCGPRLLGANDGVAGYTAHLSEDPVSMTATGRGSQ